MIFKGTGLLRTYFAQRVEDSNIQFTWVQFNNTLIIPESESESEYFIISQAEKLQDTQEGHELNHKGQFHYEGLTEKKKREK